MKVKLKQIMAGPDGCHAADAIVELDDKQAKELIKNGFAFEVNDKGEVVEPKKKTGEA